jgi:hypothetical protein
MAEKIKIQKTIYGLSSFNNLVNTSFSELTKPPKEVPVPPGTTIDKFFSDYDLLFYDIPLEGSDSSHLALASKSLEYLGISLEDLQNEINELREENISLKNQILLSSQINIGTQV